MSKPENKNNQDEKTAHYSVKSSYFHKIPLFDTLNRTDLAILTRHIRCFRVLKDHIITKEGQKGEFVCFIAEGQIDIIKLGDDGNEIVINTLGKGRSIGEMALIDETPRSATTRSKTECVLLLLTKKSFEQILSAYPETGIKVLKGISRLLSMNLRKTSGKLLDFLDN
jgi:CRP-like cAMP-binding protein